MVSSARRAARRAAPSGGRLYPLTLYAITSPAVGGIETAAYKYLPHSHSLMPLPRSFGFREDIGDVVETGDVAGDKTEMGDGECDNKEDREEPEDPNKKVKKAKKGSVIDQLCNATVPQVASMFHQEWIDAAAVIFLISGNVVSGIKQIEYECDE